MGEKPGPNLYAYVNGDPGNRNDVSGLYAVAPPPPMVAPPPVFSPWALPVIGAAIGYDIGNIPAVRDFFDSYFTDHFFKPPTNATGREELERSRDFRRWFHRVWKRDRKKQGYADSQNPDMDDDELDEAYYEWLAEGSPRVKK